MLSERISLQCSSNLANNSQPSNVTFSIKTSKDVVSLVKQEGYEILPVPLPPPPIPENFDAPIQGKILNQGRSCGSCYAFSAVEVITDRINTVGLYGAGWSTYPKDGCE